MPPTFIRPVVLRIISVSFHEIVFLSFTMDFISSYSEMFNRSGRGYQSPSMDVRWQISVLLHERKAGE